MGERETLSEYQRRLWPGGPPPPDYTDAVIEFYMKDVDRTLLRENLKLTPAERLRKYQSFLDELDAVRGLAHRGSSQR